MKKDNTSSDIGICFIIIMFSIFIIQFFLPAASFSNTENRLLQQKPIFSFQNYMNQTFQTNYSTYKNDQFLLRSRWVQKKADLEHLIGIRKYQDVFIGKRNTLFQEFPSVSNQKINNLVNAINQFQTMHTDLNIVTMMVPNRIAFPSKDLPLGAVVNDQQKAIDTFHSMLNNDIHRVLLYDVMKDQDLDQLYYKTDHHWSTKAAYLSLQPYLAVLQIENKNIIYEPLISTNNFYGTLANKTAYYREPDTIQLYIPSNDETQMVVKYADLEQETTSLYDQSKQFINDAYEIFLGGNHPSIDIKTTASTDRSLLILKDSYANCFIPFLIPYYQEIIVIDPRYYFDDLQQLIKEHDITDILFLYNANTFFQDTSLEQTLLND